MGADHCTPGLLGMLTLVICVWYLPRMVLDGVLSGGEALAVGAALVLWLMASAAIATVAPVVSGALNVVLVFGLAATPYGRYRLRDRTERNLRDREIERCRKTIAWDRKNAGAHEILGDALRAQHDYQEAIECYEAALDLEPENRSARRSLEECHRLSRISDGATWLCHVCHAENPPREIQCFQCRTPRGQEAARPSLLLRGTAWGAVACGAALLALLIAGVLTPLGAFVLTVVVAIPFFAVYTAAEATE
jgi:tetratricopeptide (TPR) repeat protein